jgi:transcriptional regulator with XRE-family HTH domain
MSYTNTLGGNRLRALRTYHGRTQLDVELDASLGTGYLQRVECGRVQQPERETLERILHALNARYTERREILELFGYVVDAPIPMTEEIQWAIAVCQTELDSAVFPAYLLDCAHRLLTWNQLVPHLFTAASLKHLSMLKMIFDPAYSFAPNIANQAEFYPAQIRALRYERQWFHDETWYNDLLADMLRCEAFAHYWMAPPTAAAHIPARPLTLLKLAFPSSDQLQFRLISEPFVQDRRFRVIYFLPADAQTIQQCMMWCDE